MSIVKTSDDIKKYISVDASFDYNSVLPYIELAEDEVKRVLGDQFKELDDYFNAANSGLPELDALLPYAQRPVVYFAVLKGLDKLNVSIGNNGIGIISNANLAPASKDRVENLRKSITDTAWDSLEYLLQYLEENEDLYPEWENSDAYAYQYQYLISTARKFDELYKINRSRLTFLEWRPTMADVEKLQIEPKVSKEMMDELKSQIKTNSVTTANAKILPFLQKALAYLTAAIKRDPKMQQPGEKYLMMAKATMDADPDSYPTYTASDIYDSTITGYQTYENDASLKLSVFGG